MKSLLNCSCSRIKIKYWPLRVTRETRCGEEEFSFTCSGRPAAAAGPVPAATSCRHIRKRPPKGEDKRYRRRREQPAHAAALSAAAGAATASPSAAVPTVPVPTAAAVPAAAVQVASVPAAT